MGALTIRNLDDGLKQELRIRGAQRGTSMEEEARSILRAVVTSKISVEEIGAIATRPAAKEESAWDLIQRLRDKYGTFDLEIPERTDMVGDSLRPRDR